MVNPTTDIIIFLAVAFVLGLSLGWTLWKLGTAEQAANQITESEFWQQRLNQARAERDIDLQRIETLEKERESLKKRIKAKSKSAEK